MTGYELIKLIQNNEIKSGQRIRMHSNFMNGYDIDLIFNGNWFSKVEDPETNYEEIILNLCNSGCTYKLIEDSGIEKLDYMGLQTDKEKYRAIKDKINEIIDYIDKEEK